MKKLNEIKYSMAKLKKQNKSKKDKKITIKNDNKIVNKK
jgi:hypothetical protein